MTTLHRFSSAVATAEAAGTTGVALLPERLAIGCAAALPVDGAGLSMLFSPDRRLPLGASSTEASTAERLQFTVGEGPCLTAAATGRPVLATEPELAARWPAFHGELVTRTRYRSAAAVPLNQGLAGIGTLTLYLERPDGSDQLALAPLLTVVDELSTLFTRSMADPARGAETPAWLDAPPVTHRAQVWVAIGLLNAELAVTSPAALALLRARAFATGTDVDQLAEELVSGRLSTEALRSAD